MNPSHASFYQDAALARDRATFDRQTETQRDHPPAKYGAGVAAVAQ